MSGQVDVAEGEKEVLQQEAEMAVAKMRAEREAMSQQQKHLAQMQHLPSHMQELQQQVPLWLLSENSAMRNSKSSDQTLDMEIKTTHLTQEHARGPSCATKARNLPPLFATA